MRPTGLKPRLSGTVVLLRMGFRFGLLASAKKTVGNRTKTARQRFHANLVPYIALDFSETTGRDFLRFWQPDL